MPADIPSQPGRACFLRVGIIQVICKSCAGFLGARRDVKQRSVTMCTSAKILCRGSHADGDLLQATVRKSSASLVQAFWEQKAAVKAAAEERLRMSLYKSPGKVASYR